MATASAEPFVFAPPFRRITVRCKVAGGAQFDLDVDPASTVRSMKSAVGAKLVEHNCTLSVEQLRLIAKGKFLEDDEVVRDCKVSPGCKLLLVRGAEGQYESEKQVEDSASVSLDVVREWEVPESAGEPTVLESTPQEDQTKCWACCRNIGLTGIQCRCKYYFCSEHRYAESHDCTFNHQLYHRSILEREILGCVAEKVEKV